MNNEYNLDITNYYNYECEDCGGLFLIIVDTDEEIIYCPQCSNNNKQSFKKLEILKVINSDLVRWSEEEEEE